MSIISTYLSIYQSGELVLRICIFDVLEATMSWRVGILALFFCTFTCSVNDKLNLFFLSVPLGWNFIPLLKAVQRFPVLFIRKVNVHLMGCTVVYRTSGVISSSFHHSLCFLLDLKPIRQLVPGGLCFCSVLSLGRSPFG